MDLSKYSVGFVYVLSNRAMPGMVKIGWTNDLGEDRAKSLYTTGVPLPFDVEFAAATSYPKPVEREAHAMLPHVRVAAKREFFQIPPSEAAEVVKLALLNASSVAAWESKEAHKVKHGDRLAFTMQAGDQFVVLRYPSPLARRAEPIDWWQAHSDGDHLELMGTDDPGHVAGFSDGDLGGNVDPVPYLDRAATIPNAEINGRERLVAGERLLWFRPMAAGQSCKVVMFEVVDHCQVISRTWEPKFGPDGVPLLLNTPTQKELPPCVLRRTAAAMRMVAPRTWAPRTPDLDHWAPYADDPQPPEYWLTQLKKQQRKKQGNRRPPATTSDGGGSERPQQRG